MRTLYVSDLDGTLLNSSGALSDRTAALLNEVAADGGLVTFATARSFSSARRATAALHLELPAITYGGTMLVDPSTGTMSDVQLLSAEVVGHALAASDAHEHVQLILFTFEDGRDWLRWDPSRLTPGTARFVEHRAGDPRLRPITPDDPADAAAVFYITSLAPRSVLVDYRLLLSPRLDGVAVFLSEDPHTPGLDWLEFHSEHGTKAAAITRVAAEVGVDRIVVFGDNHNDVPMFVSADEGHAVANAVPELKAVATSVLGHHDADAVAEWIAADHRTASVEP
jgi:hydroxymethylpyrimidine pyrophosphatase-like HAD family hydrolase